MFTRGMINRDLSQQSARPFCVTRGYVEEEKTCFRLHVVEYFATWVTEFSEVVVSILCLHAYEAEEKYKKYRCEHLEFVGLILDINTLHTSTLLIS